MAPFASCGSDSFHLLHVGERLQKAGETPYLRFTKVNGEWFLRVAVQCAACASEHLLLDDKLHGWNGYVCASQEKKEMPRPPYQGEWLCHKCQPHGQKITLWIQGEEMEEAIGESSGKLTEADWFEGFCWLSLHVSCSSCGSGPTRIVDYEAA